MTLILDGVLNTPATEASYHHPDCPARSPSPIPVDYASGAAVEDVVRTLIWVQVAGPGHWETMFDLSGVPVQAEALLVEPAHRITTADLDESDTGYDDAGEPVGRWRVMVWWPSCAPTRGRSYHELDTRVASFADAQLSVAHWALNRNLGPTCCRTITPITPGGVLR
jgi:hypothetical protein